MTDQPAAPSTRVTEAELLEYETSGGSWRWVGWNYGGEAFWNLDSREGALVGPDGEPVLSATTTEGEDARVAVASPEAARLVAAAPRLVAEIRRYRALMIGLAKDGPGFPSGPCEDTHCLWCGAWLDGMEKKHAEGCPWPELEAEVQAIRQERQR